MGELKIIKQIQDKNGIINILEIQGKSTQEEIDNFYKKLAELLIKDHREYVEAT